MYAVRILVSLRQKSSAFRKVLCQPAPDPVTLRFMHSGPTFRLRSSLTVRIAQSSAAVARANGGSRNVGAKAKKQPLI